MYVLAEITEYDVVTTIKHICIKEHQSQTMKGSQQAKI